MENSNHTLWIARDEDGYLYVYWGRPLLDKEEGQKGSFYSPKESFERFMRLDSQRYPEVTFENSPQRLLPENSKTN